MDSKNFEVLFTHQKQKKNKTWQDGLLKVLYNGTKAVLYDDGGNSLEVFHIQSDKVFPGSDVECERYLISIGDEKTNSCPSMLPDINENRSTTLRPLDGVVKKRKRELYMSCKPDLPSPHHFSKASKPLFNSQTKEEKAIPRQLTVSNTLSNFDETNHLKRSKLHELNSTCTPEQTNIKETCLPFHQTVYNAPPPQKRNREELLSLFSCKVQTPVNTEFNNERIQTRVNIEFNNERNKPQKSFGQDQVSRFINEGILDNQEYIENDITDHWNEDHPAQVTVNNEMYSKDPFTSTPDFNDYLLDVSDYYDDTDCVGSFYDNFDNKTIPVLDDKPEIIAIESGSEERNEFLRSITNDVIVEDEFPNYVNQATSSNDVITEEEFPNYVNQASSNDVISEEEFPNYVNQATSSNGNRSSTVQRSHSFTAPLVSGSTTSMMSGQQHTRSNLEQSYGQSCGELIFPSSIECCGNVTPSREVTIPVKFQSALQYKQILKSAIKEHLNIILFELAQRYFGILTKVDIASLPDSLSDQKENIKGPSCSHGQAKLRAVKKDGPNKGRHFYSCPGSGSNQCKFFKWADECNSGLSNGNKKLPLASTDSIRVYFKSNNVHLYHDCVFERRVPVCYSKKLYKNKYSRGGRSREFNLNNEKKSMYIVLKYRENSSLYSKDDIWIISKSLNFESNMTFIARSVFYGPSSSGDLEIEPMSGYSQSNWKSGDTVHAIWACNAGTELSCIKNLDEHVTLQHMPILAYLLNGARPSSSRVHCRSSFTTPMTSGYNRDSLGITWQVIEEQTEMVIVQYKLNEDQAAAIRSCTRMFMCEEGTELSPVTLIHGVFGAGKSFLLAVVVLLMVKLFEIATASNEVSSVDWKILISSTTNVAVDRILLGILDLGFDQFIRVGSLRKIAKPILPFSIHSVGSESQELKELQGMLKSDLTSSEKTYVRKSIDRHKLGENRKRLSNVRVVGVTCAACIFPSLEKLKFPVVLLDECSQMTEPNSLLPVARFGCRKLVLVGDPKQLNPTIQGSEPQHDAGLEQTLFDRLIKMEIQPILLRTQYRCHPKISSVANRLFYNGSLLDGVTDDQRKPVTEFLPTLCFYNVPKGREECSQDGSYFNKCEANFVVFLIKSLLDSEVDPTHIGVITQYKSQLTTITNSLMTDESTSHKELKGIQISTVDAFQGGEKDVIILSCVRTQHVGFIDCKRRTNVALTRAKRHLCIVGCGKMLSTNTLWGNIIDFCRESNDGVQSCEQFISHWNEIKPTLPKYNTKKNKTSNNKKLTKPKKISNKKKTPKQDVIVVDGNVSTLHVDKTSDDGVNEVITINDIKENDEQTVTDLVDDEVLLTSCFDTIADDDFDF